MWPGPALRWGDAEAEPVTVQHSSFATARSVNSEAGEHPISADPIERASAETATRLSWREFPYYPRRYGERGYRFSISDSGWLETLCRATPSAAVAQVTWLANVLSNRGMPSYLMERHLAHLRTDLVRSAPDRASRYAILEHCETSLRERRQSQIGEPSFRALASSFEEAVASSVGRIPNVGLILVSAVADERSGVSAAVESVESFVLDAARFDAAWLGAVRGTLRSARSVASGR